MTQHLVTIEKILAFKKIPLINDSMLMITK